MKSAVRNLILGLLVSMFFAGSASAQYMKITTDNPASNTRMRATGTTILTITLDTNHDKNAALQTCNSHTAANGCGAATTSQALDMYGYTLALKATGGTVTWGSFTPADAAYTDSSPPTSNSTEIEINQFRPTGTFTAPGLVTIGTLAVTPLTGDPSIGLQVGAGALNPFGFGTGFFTECDGFFFPNSYVVGDPTDPCGASNGLAGDWFDWDGALSSSGNSPPAISAPATATGDENVTITPVTATATDVDGGNTLTITQTGVPGFLTFSSSPGPSPNTATVSGKPGFTDAGVYGINWLVNDGAGGTSNTSTQLTINNTNRAPTLNQPANMTVNEGSTAEQTITGSDPDGQSLAFLIVAGPPYMTILLDTATSGIVHLAPNFTNSGTAAATVRATDQDAVNPLFSDKSFNITVNNTNRAPTLTQPTNMTVAEGATADQTVIGSDPDGDALTFSRASAQTFVTVTTSTVTSGNVHIAPGAGAAALSPYSVTVTATDTGALTNSKSFQLTVIAGTNNAPVLAQPANMTVNEGSTADQTLNATDADGQALTFSLVSGPTYASVTTTTPGTGTATGNLHLAPGFSDAGTAAATVRASDGTANNDKSLTITVNNINRPPTLNQPANMTVNEGVTADQVITGTDPDGDSLTFTRVSGPTYLTVTTTNATTGNIHLAPGFSDSGTAGATVTATDNGTPNFSNNKSFTITVNNTNRAPTLNQPANMSVAQGATADQVITGTDPDGDALTFTKVSGPTFLTVTTTNATTGNIHLAAGASETVGTSGATVRASDGSLTNDKTLTVTVTATNQAPVLTQPANMTVNEGATADQTLNAIDADNQALTFSLVSGPTYASVTTTTPGTGTATGNIHLAPGFSNSGTAGATVRASDGSLSNDKSLTITVNNVNRAPTLNQPANMTVNEGATADQVITGTDPDGDALTFSLVAGPSFTSVTTTNATSGGIHLAPGFSDAGAYGATVRANDGTLTNDKTLTITVNSTNRAPVLNQPANMTVNEGATADQAITATDPDGDALTFTKVSGPTYLTVSTANATTGNIHLAPGFSDAGTASATVQASDGTLTDSKSLTITVNNVNRAPTLNQPTNMSVAQGGTADQVITGTDPDGDALTFTKVAGPTFLTVTTTNATTGNIHLAAGALEPVGTSAATVQASDGTLTNDKTLTVTVTATNQAPTLTQPANMTVNEGATADQTLNATDPDGNALTFSLVSGPTYASVTTTAPGTGTATGNIHLAPGFSDAGTAGATVRASDGSLNSDKSVTITVNDTNRAPTLNQPTNMSVAQGATADQAITGSDPDGDALTFSKVAGPTFLTVTTTNATTGNIHLAAGALEPVGTSAATVQASDGSLTNSKTLTITVTGTNQAPTLTQPADMTVDEGATADQTLNATDPDGNALTFSLVSGPTYASVTTTTPGTGTATGNIHLAPGFSDAGAAAATVRASDGSLSDDKSLTITVNNTNRAPTLNAPVNMTVVQGTTADQVLTGSDPDGDALTFIKISGPAFMTVTTTNATTGNIHLAPGASEPLGLSAAAVRAADGNLFSNAEPFTVTVTGTNQAPTLTQPADMTVDEGATADQTLDATDPDGNALTFSLVSGPTYASVTTTTPGTGTATGNIHLVPGFSDAGTAGATVRASDGSLSDDKSLTITVNNTNRAPTLNPIANMTATEGATADQSISGSDPDGDALTFTKQTGPTLVTITTSTPTTGNVHVAPITGDAAGSPYIVLTKVSDGTDEDSKIFSVTVQPVAQENHAPVLTQPADMTVNEGATADQTLTASDQDGDALSFTKVGGPAFLTVGTSTSTTGNAHLAPGFADAGTYGATVRASDGSLTNDKSFQITVNNVNRAPVADAGGPYAGVAGVPVSFDGTGSSDPDGNALTYSWDFDATNGITSEATGAKPSHTYTGAGSFTVTLTVTDNATVPLSDTDTATADISASNGFEAKAFVNDGDRVIRLNSFRPFWCVELEPVKNSFRVTDIIKSSILLTYNGTSIHGSGQPRIVLDDCVARLKVCFRKDQFRALFASLSNGRRSVKLAITGNLAGGGTFHASLDIVVVKGGWGWFADGDNNDGHHAFAFANPNPLNPSTTINFILSQPGSVRLNVYDVSGRLVKTLANEFMGTGPHSVGWDGTSRQGARVASGVYFYVLQTPEITVKSHLVVAK